MIMGIHVFWDSRAPAGLSKPAAEGISSVLNTEIGWIDGGTFPLDGFDPARGQYDALKILSKLDLFRSMHPELFKPKEMSTEYYRQNCHHTEKVLLITSGDLYTPKNNFVFGLSHIKLGVAVVSATRLDNRFFGRYADDASLIKRIITESCHELGHLYSLEHCENPSCIMYCPNNLDQLDAKNTIFCGRCRLELDSAMAGGTL